MWWWKIFHLCVNISRQYQKYQNTVLEYNWKNENIPKLIDQILKQINLGKNCNKSLPESDWIFMAGFETNMQSDKYICMLVISLCVHKISMYTHTQRQNIPLSLSSERIWLQPEKPAWHFESSKRGESTYFPKTLNSLDEWTDDIRCECSGTREELFWQWEQNHTAERWEMAPSQLWWCSQI